MENYKDIVIEERSFRIGRMSAMVGSRILNILLSVIAKAQTTSSEAETEQGRQALDKIDPEERANVMVEASWVLVGDAVSEETYSQIQRHCLQVCAMYVREDNPPVPIITNNGRWAAKEIEHDIKIVSKLVTEALKFNLSPFFIESTSKSAQAESAAPAIPPPHTRRATGTFSVPS